MVFEASIAIFCFIPLCFFLFMNPRDNLLRNWPVLGMLPGLLVEFHRIYEFSVEILRSSNLTFTFKGPWYSGMDMLFTVDQANIHHIVSSNLSNYTKEEGAVVDLQDVFVRFTFDTTLVMVTGSADPRSLCVEMPEADEFAKALNDVEKKLSKADAILTRMCARFIYSKREEIISREHAHTANDEAADLLTSHMKLDATKYDLLNPSDGKFLRDTMLSFILAGRDATASALTWFFWLLSENPEVVTKIRQELNTNLIKIYGQARPSSDYSIECLNKLVYLRGALYESMRLYPPVPFERMTPGGWKQYGEKTHWNSSLGETGEFREEPSYKFFAFFGGPRSCLGKLLAMTLMKTVVVEILQNYDFQLVKGQTIEPATGPILRMKHGLRVKLTKRCSSYEINGYT
ncbi:hypothetical protein HID58_014930 [Brassica napus]|uniref:Cytochrome P450 n=1 Tax=Brassica napus TaxID=3708 RepID=A0ABQ8DIQ3_BRANA|nr:hypothetical protein HID58_014930 [Brassica napus]